MPDHPSPVNTFIKIQDQTIRLDRIIRYKPISGTVGTMLGKGMLLVYLINGEELAFTYPTKGAADADIKRLDDILIATGRAVA